MPATRPRTRKLAAAGAALVLGLAGCGGGGGAGDGAAPDPGATGTIGQPATTSATGPAPATTTPVASFRTLANAVCRAEVSGVPPVPEAGTAAQRRTFQAATGRYVSAVRDAADGLADAFVLLERRRPESQDALGPLVTRARAVVRAARAADRPGAGDAGSSSGIDDELRITIALLNEASSAAGLPTCAL